MDNEKKASVLHIVKTTGILMVITAAVAVLLAAVNLLTEPVIRQKTEAAKQDAILALFPEATDSFSLRSVNGIGDQFPATVTDLYAIYNGDIFVGFAAETSSMGFSDKIGMIVGVNADNTVRGVRIMSISDTPGLGMKVRDPAYLNNYAGLSYPILFGKGAGQVDAVSSATYSSAGVLKGVNDALAFCSLIVVSDNTEGGSGNE